MRQIIVYVLALLLTISCGQSNDKSSSKVNENKSIIKAQKIPPANDSNSAVLTYDTASFALFPLICKNAKSTDLTIDEIKEIDKLINDCTAKYSVVLDDLTAYKRQYVAVINNFGQKIVWVNFFCDNSSYWKTQPIIVSGGGGCYFQLKVNLTLKYYYDF
ncbi:MAG: hypothetical protein ABR968_05330, partial [Bacteroidales bacterium]